MIVLGDDYLDVRRSEWQPLETRGAVRARGPFVHLKAEAAPAILPALWSAFPTIYAPPAVSAVLAHFAGEVVAVCQRRNSR